MTDTTDSTNRFQTLWQQIRPYADILIFVVAMLGANWFWKLTVKGDELGGPVTWFGIELTPIFDAAATWITSRAYWWLQLFKDNVYRASAQIFGFFNDTISPGDDVRIAVVWGCTGIKQAFIWLIIMLTARGSRLDHKWSLWSVHKLWFIPLGWGCIYLFNIFRIAVIALLIEHHPDMFAFWHEHIFKYLFYGMLFLLWVLWVERVAGIQKQQK